ncbi:hypothetical protein Efla_000491 [Eimeria flavescens]
MATQLLGRLPGVLRVCLGLTSRGRHRCSPQPCCAVPLRLESASWMSTASAAPRVSPAAAESTAPQRACQMASSSHANPHLSSERQTRRGVGGGPLHPESVDPFQPQPKRRMDLKLGPYAGGRLFVSPKEDPKEFILCVIVVAIFLYTLVTTYTQPGKLKQRGETVNQRRRRIIQERLMKEAGITQADLDDLEAEEAPLSS